MKRVVFLRSLCLFLLCASVVEAGVQMAMELENRRVLQFESVNVFLTIKNDSGIPLIIDDYGTYATNEVYFEVVRDNRYRDVVSKRKGRIVEEVMLLPDQKTEVMVDLDDFYDLSEPGRYFVKPCLAWNGLHYKGKTQVLDVVPGFEVKKIRRAVPGYQDLHRDFKLLYWTRDGEEHLFVRVDEVESNFTYGTLAIGRLIRVREPTLTVDKDGRITVVHQSAPGSYLKTTLVTHRNYIELEDQVQIVENQQRPARRALIQGLNEMNALSGDKSDTDADDDKAE